MRPVLFHEPWAGHPVFAYGFCLGLAILIGWNLAAYLGQRRGAGWGEMQRGIVTVLVLALAGARAFWVASFPGTLGSLWDCLDVSRGGMVAYGGFLGGALGAWLAAPGRLGFLGFADVVTPGVVLGTAVTRLGCFLNGCDFGRPTALPWAVRFPRLSPAWRQHLEQGTLFRGELVTPPSTLSLPVHPTQLYEAALALGILSCLLLARRRLAADGQIFFAFAALYGLGRAAIELVRGDAQRGTLLGLPPSQAIGLVTGLLALAWVLRARGRRAGLA
jgi:phosphatidylglycerol---prolipoprotein diacylglyceryl transferase